MIYSITTELQESSFDNLDSWVDKNIVPKYEKEIIQKLLREEKKPVSGEEKKNQNEPGFDPLRVNPSRGLYNPFGNIQNPHQPHIIGDPTGP